MLKIIDTIKYWLIAAGLLFLYLFGYKKGVDTEKNKQRLGTINVIKNAKQSRDSLSDSARIDRLHNKYKR